MEVWVEPGKYVIAVSGGVDSMALLHLLAHQPGLQLTVAHFDHGMREDSKTDRELVQKVAQSYDLPFVYDVGHLGSGSGEARARKARYEFLQKVQSTAGASAIITAHHQDDVLETTILNVLRGTGRKGLSSLQDREGILRPLLNVSKQTIQAYAKKNNIVWREDSTNQDTRYLRNYIRHKIIPQFKPEEKQALLKHIKDIGKLNKDIDNTLVNHLHVQPTRDTLDRDWFIMLPHAVALELLASWLRQHDVRGFNKKQLEKLLVAAKTYQAGKWLDVNVKHVIKVNRDDLVLLLRTDGQLS